MSDARFPATVDLARPERVEVSATTIEPGSQTQLVMAPTGGGLVSMTLPVKAEFQFTAADQEALASILRAELVRLGVFQVDAPEGSADFRVQLVFTGSEYERSINRYEVALDMALTAVAGHTTTRSYRLDSNQGKGRWAKLNTSVWKGKMQLAEVALLTLVPDIVAFAGATPPDVPPP